MAEVDLTYAFSVVEGMGIVAGAAGGALDAKRREEYDVFGLAALAFAGALGGGLLRDVLINQGAPAAFTEQLYLPLVLLVALVIAVIPGEFGPRTSGVIRVFDAVAIGAFSVVAADRAHEAGFTILACLLLGVIGGIGGLLMRDVLTATQPEVFRRGELNGIAALAGAGVFIALLELGVQRPIPAIAGIAAGFVLRLAALRWDLRAPAPRR
ncbi:MAG: TRIC cation channel family protein [Solirubrobacteraceae bacterium]|nr:TRIC cation channel family protein [Solirubrobacteraceae bacterium]